MAKINILLFGEYEEHFDLLSKEEQGELIMAIFAYANRGEVPGAEVSLSVRMAFSFIKADMDRNSEKYEEKCARNKVNGQRGGRPRKEEQSEEKPNGLETGTEKPNGLEIESEKPNGFLETHGKSKSKSESKSDKELKDSCTEPTAAPVISMPLNDGSEFPVTEEMVKEWGELYPAVDVMQQLRNARGWLVDNPTRRKTRNGIRRYLGNWLAKEQNRGRAAPYRAEKEVREYQKEQRDLNFLMEG